MLQTGETFFTSIGCMDGRVQEPIMLFGRKYFGAKYPDTITEAGLVGQLSKEDIDDKLLKSLKGKIMISLEKHHSKGIIVHGHEECAGNPVENQKHIEGVKKSASLIRSLVSQKIKVLPVFVKREGGNWVVQEIQH